MHWKEVRDEMDLEASKPKDMDIEDVQQYIEDGAYEKLISVSTV